MTNEKKSVKSNIIFNGLKTLAGILFPFISFPYAARVLGATNLGKVQYCASIITYFALFAELGIEVYATREGVKYRDNKSELTKFVKEVLTLNIITTLISYVALLALIFIFGLEKYRVLLFVCGLSIFFKTFQIDWLYQIVEDFKYISIRIIALQFISLALLFLLVRQETDYVNYAFVTVFSSGGSFALNFINSKRYVNWRGQQGKLNIRRHLKPVLIIFGITASAQIYLNLDVIMIGALRGETDVGYYSASVKLINAIKVMLASVSTALLARLSSFIVKGEKTNFDDLISKSMNLILMLVIPCCYGLIVLRRETLLLLYGSEYIVANISLALLSVNMIFSVIDGVLYQQVTLPLHLEGKACRATIIGAVINLISNYFFINQFGYNGAAFTTLLSELVVFGFLLYGVKEYVDIHQLFGETYQYVLCGAVMFLILFIIHRAIGVHIWNIIIFITLGIVIYFVLLNKINNPYTVGFLKGIRSKLS